MGWRTRRIQLCRSRPLLSEWIVCRQRLWTPGGGDLVTLTGQGFHVDTADDFVVTIGGKLCTGSTVVSPTTATCHSPSGTGANNVIVAFVRGFSSPPRTVLSYFIPSVDHVSTQWSTGGSRVTVDGAYFTISALLWCRFGEPQGDRHNEIPARWESDRRLFCEIPTEVTPGPHSVYISNDGGYRWSSGATLQYSESVHWFNGTTQPLDGKRESHWR